MQADDAGADPQQDIGLHRRPALSPHRGTAQSTFSMREAMDEGYWVIVNLEKGRLGEQALTLGSLSSP